MHNLLNLKALHLKQENDQDLREEVATLCGWKDIEDRKGHGQWYGRRPPDFNGWTNLPDYPNDLNAMHEAEETIVDVQRRRYWNILEGIVRPDEYTEYFDVVHATARQRAEAFVLTMENK